MVESEANKALTNRDLKRWCGPIKKALAAQKHQVSFAWPNNNKYHWGNLFASGISIPHIILILKHYLIQSAGWASYHCTLGGQTPIAEKLNTTMHNSSSCLSLTHILSLRKFLLISALTFFCSSLRADGWDRTRNECRGIIPWNYLAGASTSCYGVVNCWRSPTTCNVQDAVAYCENGSSSNPRA